MVFSSLFLKEIWKNDTRTRGHGRMFTWAKGKQQKQVKQLVSGTVYWSYPILPFGIVACTVFPTTFLEIAVYGLQKLNGAIGLHYDKESIDRSKPGNVLPFCHSLKSELWMKLLPTCRGIIAVINSPVTWEKFDLPGLQILTAPKLSTNDEWQLSIHTLGWERKYTQKERKRKKSKLYFGWAKLCLHISIG